MLIYPSASGSEREDVPFCRSVTGASVFTRALTTCLSLYVVFPGRTSVRCPGGCRRRSCCTPRLLFFDRPGGLFRDRFRFRHGGFLLLGVLCGFRYRGMLFAVFSPPDPGDAFVRNRGFHERRAANRRFFYFVSAFTIREYMTSSPASFGCRPSASRESGSMPLSAQYPFHRE